MSLTVSSTATAHLPVDVAPSKAAVSKAAAPRPTAAAAPPPAAASSAQQVAALNQLMAKYKADLSRGMPASTLSGLGRQTMAAAKTAGQHVSLPRGSGGSVAAAAAPAATPAPAPATGTISITA